ncbi:MAG: hypothetical protein ABH806_00165 [Candidatus Omnitrophota bacterium]
MPDTLERLIRIVYKKWKQAHRLTQESHPDEEAWVCFFDGRLSAQEDERIKEHLISCEFCSEIVAAVARSEPVPVKTLPKDLAERAKDLVVSQERFSVAEIIILLKEKMLEILSITGDVLVGEEFVPAPVLRSRKIKEFKDEITILKDFKDIRVEVKIQNKLGQSFDLFVFVKDKQSHRIIKDLRITLLKGDLELESYLTASDKVIFEHVLAGKYTVEISNADNKIASVLLDIRK